MSFKYLVEIKQNKVVVETTTTDKLSKAVRFAEKSSLVGDLVVISEGYMATDGQFDAYDHVNSWYVDEN